MNNKYQLNFMSDALFKYSFGKVNKESKILRQFLLKEILEKNYDSLKVVNPELIPEMIRQKNVILDILVENKDIRIGIDMQATSLNRHLYKRFQQYLSRLCSEQLIVGDNYSNIKPAIMILFVKDFNPLTPSLIVRKTWVDLEFNVLLPYRLQELILVQLPYIEIIALQKAKLSEFEAVIYFVYKNSIDGITWENKEGVIDIMKKMSKRFMSNQQLYGAAVDRHYFAINYDLMLKDAKEEYAEIGLKEGLEQGINQGLCQGVRQERESNALLLIQGKYHQDASSWITECTLEQLQKVSIFCFQNIDYETFQRRIISS